MVTNHHTKDIAHLGNIILLWIALTSISWGKKITYKNNILLLLLYLFKCFYQYYYISKW